MPNASAPTKVAPVLHAGVLRNPERSIEGWIVENCPQCRNDLIRPCGGVGESDTAFADRECKIIIAGGRERCTDLRRPQKLLELDDCRSSRRTGREHLPQDVLRFAQRVFEDNSRNSSVLSSLSGADELSCASTVIFFESETCLEPSTDSQASVSCLGLR